MNPLTLLVGLAFAATPFVGPYFIMIAAAVIWLLMLIRWVIKSRRMGEIASAEVCVIAFSAWAAVMCHFRGPVEFTPSVFIEYCSPAVMFIVALRASQTVRQWRTIGIMYLVGCLVAVAVLMFNWMTNQTAGESLRFTVGELNSNYIAYCLATAIPVALSLLWNTEQESSRYLVFGVVMLIALGVVLTVSRGAAIASSVCVLIVFARSLARQSRYLLVLVPALVIAWFAALQVLPKEVVNRLAFADSESGDLSSGRLDQFNIAFGLIEQHPYLGNGPNSFISYNSDPVQLHNNDPIQLHNVFLHVTADFGLVGLALFLAAVIAALAARNRQRLPWYSWALPTFIATWLVLAATGVWAFAPPAWFAFGWFFGSPPLHAGGREPNLPKP